MSDLWVDSGGASGARAHLPDRVNRFFEVSGGKRCAVHRRNGVPVVLGEILAPHDPRWVSLVRVWLSKDEVYLPPSGQDDAVLRSSSFITKPVPIARLLTA